MNFTRHFTLTILLFVAVIITGIVYAQDAPKKDDTPDKIELTADQTKAIKEAQKDAQLVSLQVENLQLKIQQAQEELKKLQEDSQKKGQKLSELFAEATKMPVEKLNGYTIEEVEGKFILKKK